MQAAVVRSFHSAPHYEEFPTPVPVDEDELLVDVLATGLHPRVRSQANGSHYTSTEELPLVPGIDGVGRGTDGLLRYFILPDTTMGAMAQQTVIDRRRSVVLPEGTDPIAVAAGMNPAMSSWIALRQRIAFQAGQNVAVLAATGNAGQLAVQVAKLFGAGKIIAVGRGADRLAKLTTLGATDTVLLEGNFGASLAAATSDVDVVIDYLWGEPAVSAMTAVVTGRADPGQPLTWIQIGSVAGATAAIPSAALRSTRLSIVGSGQGSVSAREIVSELPALAEAITNETLDIDARPMPLSEVEAAWAAAATTSRRIVLIP